MTSVHPLANRALYIQAEQAAEAVLAAQPMNKVTRDLTRSMDDAACKVFVAAGAASDVARFYATCITCDVLKRAQPARPSAAPSSRT